MTSALGLIYPSKSDLSSSSTTVFSVCDAIIYDDVAAFNKENTYLAVGNQRNPEGALKLRDHAGYHDLRKMVQV